MIKVNLNKPRFVLTAIAVITIIACVATGVACGVFAVTPMLTFLIGCFIGSIGVYAYHRVALMFILIRLLEGDL